MDTTPRVFISYARTDGEEFAAKLFDMLTAELGEGTILMDRRNLEGGKPWWKQLKGMLDSVRFMVLIATPGALASENVEDEWNYAREHGLCIYPLQIPGYPINFEALPKWRGMKQKLHFHDWEKERSTVIAHLKQPCKQDKVPFMAPDLPSHFVERPREFGELVSRVLDKDRQNPVAITTALKGAGGFGKTTLALALCHDEDVQAAFDDGILWVTLGEQPDVLGGLTKLYAALTGERTGFIDVEDAAKELAEKLANKDCLIVIDDVWNGAHLQPFLRGGERCARLITTRDVGIAVGAKAALTDVDEMTADESIRLLSGGILGLEPARLERMAKRLGEWALMLELANAMLHERMATAGDTPELAFIWLEKVLDRRGVTGVHRDNEVKRKQDAAGVLASSLELLKLDQRERLCQLAVFKDDADVPLSSVYRLWDMDEFEAEELVLLLARRSLIKFSSRMGTIRLHDVVREYLATQVGDIPTLHRKLIEAWGDVHSLPDQYAWHQYCFHLNEAGHTDQLRNLLLSYRWLSTKLYATDLGALLADYAIAAIDTPLKLVEEALSMSAHVLALDKSALAHQLVGRLMSHRQHHLVIRTFTNDLVARIPSIYPADLDSPYSVLDQAGGALLRTLTGHPHDVMNVIVTAHDRALSRSYDGTLKIWDLTSYSELMTMAGISLVAVTDDGRAISGPIDGSFKVWDLSTYSELATLECPAKRFVSDLILTTDGCGLLLFEDGTLGGWDLSNYAELHNLSKYPPLWNKLRPFSLHIALVPDGRMLVGIDDKIHIWDLDKYEQVMVLGGDKGRLGSLTVTSDGRILCGKEAGTLEIWDLTTYSKLISIKGHRWSTTALAVTNDGRMLSGSRDGSLRLWDLETYTEVMSLVGHTDEITSIAVTNDGRALSASRDDTVKVWDLTRHNPKQLTGHSGKVSGLAVNGDGRVLSASEDGTIKVWDLRTYAEITTLKGHSYGVIGVLSTSDGRALSWSHDRTLKVWDLTTYSEIATLHGHTDNISNVSMRHDGRALSSSTGSIFDDSANKLKLWDLTRYYEIDSFENDTTGWEELQQKYPDTSSIYNSFPASNLQVRCRGQVLILAEENGAELARFYGDASFEDACIIVENKSIKIIAGDSMGRILFLRWQS